MPNSKQYFRNIIAIKNIEPFALWLLDVSTNALVLVDDDQYIAVNYQEHLEDFQEFAI